MKIHVFCILRNESYMLPFFLRHYEQFAEKIYILDGQSTDQTRQIAQQNAKVVLLSMENDGIDDELFARIYATLPRKVSQSADYVICVDADEFVYWDRKYDFSELEGDVITPQGWQMISDTLPYGDKQIYDYVKEGIRDRMLDKPCIWKPSVELHYEHGRHGCRTEATCVESDILKLLHYRFLSREYVEMRHDRNYKRLSQNNLRVGSGVHNKPDWVGYQSMEWYKKALWEKIQCID